MLPRESIQSPLPSSSSSPSSSRRRPYSRLGCRECKRRKIKCTEEKPACSICLKLNKVCSYPLPGEKVLRISRRLIREEIDSLATNSTQFLPIQYDLPKNIKPQQRQPSEDNKNNEESSEKTRRSPVHINNLVNDMNSVSSSPQVLPTSIVRPPHEQSQSHPMNGDATDDRSITTAAATLPDIFNNDIYQFSGTDLSVLTTDLNNLVNEIMGFSNFPTWESTDDNFQTSSPYLELAGQPHPEPKPPQPTADKSEITRNIPIDFLQFQRKHETLYFEQFYHNFANIILPFDAYDPISKTISNPVRDVILIAASREPFLLAAILAEGAKHCYDRSHLSEDERAYGIYLSKCLKLLDQTSNNIINTSNVKIEATLLTLLLLTASTATSMKKWRPHLSGAKDLLLRLSTKQNAGKISKPVVFCKYWFITIEILAGLSTEVGGTLQEDWEVDAIISPGDEYEMEVLKEMGLITEKGFSVIGGYSHASFRDFRDLLKLLNKHKRNNTGDDKMEPLRVLSNFYEQTTVCYINPKGIINDSELKQSNYTSGLPIEEIRINDERYWISWQDVSHQSYILSSIIIILTKFFQVNNHNQNIQYYVQELLSFIAYLAEFSDASEHASPYLLLMLQWPLLIAGMNCHKRDQKELLRRFFRMANQVGSASSNKVLNMLNQMWEGESGETDDNTDTLIY
ncbi:uncharacterized protein J8A68_004571 [[Candida] subhashii]|uniref:Zn(2)-C6 fungal-type domain-containing protein n=1 Tax=[Candida] subhashii TaxID=561895 RepID=A0A8J5Q5Q5_9ASCO|nr:uncharacterized protein J8A68_004571 [[Candida] subhashii]KAG7661904.1 hypothetical protein J8A68_004571 [[Candida] subhashii]